MKFAEGDFYLALDTARRLYLKRLGVSRRLEFAIIEARLPLVYDLKGKFLLGNDPISEVVKLSAEASALQVLGHATKAWEFYKNAPGVD